jgi:DNA-directed RNA polymerase subunit RPC12/RpoP
MPLKCPNCVHQLRYWEVARVCDCPKCKRRLLVSGWRKVALVDLVGFLVFGSLAHEAFYSRGSLILTAVFVALWVCLDFLAHRHLLRLALAPNATTAPMSSDST